MKGKLFLSEPGIACAAGNNAADFWRTLTTGSQDGLVKVKTHSGRDFFAAKISDGALKKTKARYDMRVIQIEDAALEQIAPAVLAAKEKYGAALPLESLPANISTDYDFILIVNPADTTSNN